MAIPYFNLPLLRNAMKLATYKDGSRDGQLVVVSRDLKTAHYATGIAHKLQQVLDDWNFHAPQLQDIYDALNRTSEGAASASKARHAFPFDPRQCMAPLPRAYQRVGSSAFANALRLYPCSGDNLLGACDDVVCAREADDIDFAAGLAVITGDVPMGATPAQALEGVRLLMLANDLSLQKLHAVEVATAFSPVAVTLDELSFSGVSAWDKGRVKLALLSTWNGRKVGLCDAGAGMKFHFGQLLAQLCKTRHVRAGTIIGSGPVSSEEASGGYHCIAEKRALETRQDGQPLTEFMKFGDTLKVDMKGRDGLSLFGAIEQEIVPQE